jgi:hypothetical protein
MKEYRFSSAFVVLCALAFFSSPAFGQTVINPSFETDASTSAATGAITVSFSGLKLSGFEFPQISPSLAGFGIGPVV